MGLEDKIKQPEGRKLEFKECLPATIEVAKIVIAFANDAGGELFLGVKDKPRLVVGIPEFDLNDVENQLSNLISDLCEPIILPEINYIEIDGKRLIQVSIHRGTTPPYYLKSKGKQEGTYIRVGSSNRQANTEIVAQLERQATKHSYDKEVVFGYIHSELNLERFANLYLERTKEKLSEQVIQKLDLVSEYQGKLLPTHALVLLSDSPLRKSLFPNAKIECARFKGNIPGTFIDDKTIDSNVSEQAEQAYQFLMRHVSKGTIDYEGVYRNDRWEYPMIAIREVIRNAVIHRDYSLTRKDIKVAIFDDKIEITSPGKLMPTVDFKLMEDGQSDIRNKTLAPVFKKLGIVEQWGNGLRLIAEDLKQYPEVEFSWKEPGVSFRVVFKKKSIESQPESQPESMSIKVLKLLANKTLSKKELSLALGQKNISGQLNKVVRELVSRGLIAPTEQQLNSSRQQYKMTPKGVTVLKSLK